MQRVAKVLYRTTGNDPCRMQFHNNDCFGEQVHPGPASYFMEHLPYVSDLWFGEQFDHNGSPDYWLLEMSGIPFGVTGEMLQGGGNAHRGMIYGMTSRLHPSHPAMWKFWDEFGSVLKEGPGEDFANKEKLAGLFRFATHILVA